MNKLMTRIVGATLGLAMAIGVGVGVANDREAKGLYASTASITGSTFESLSGNLDTNVSYAAAQGDGTTAPALSSGNLRIYKPASGKATGGLITITAASGYSMSSCIFTLANDKSGTIKYSVDGGSLSSALSVTKNTSTTNLITSGNAGTVTIYNCGSDRLSFSGISVIYDLTGGGTPTPTISFSKDSISGEVNDNFSFTWTEQDLEDPITWSPASASTDIIDYEVNTGTKTVSGTLKKAGEVTLTATSGSASDSIDFVVTEHETHRKYTITSKTAVSQSGDTMTGATPSYSQTYGTVSQATAGNSMTLKLTGLTKKVNINKLVLSMKSNASNGAGSVSITIDGQTPSFIAGTSSSSGAGFNTFGDNTTYGGTYRDVTWSGLNYTAKSSIEIKIYCITTNSLYCQSFDIFFTEQVNNDVVSALSISPNTWTGFDSETLNVADFTVSVTTNGEPGIAIDYSYLGIGYMDGETFVARNANFTSGHPTTDDTRLCWKANYPTTAGGSTYLYAYVTLNVSHDGVSTVVVSGNMSKTSYFTTDSWDTEGLAVKAIYAGGSEEVVTGSASFKFYRESTLENEVATPNALGVGNNQTVYVKATYSNISNQTGYSQTVTVTVEHGSVESDPLTAVEAIAMVSSKTNGYETSKQYYIHGVISKIDTDELSEANNWATFWLEEDNETFGFEAYRIKPDSGCTNYEDLKVGAEVLIKCKIKKYSGSTIENGSVASLLSITYSAPELAGIVLNKSSLLLGVNEEFDLVVSPNPIGAELGAITWSSSNNNVATVVDGTVTAVAPGTAVITVEAGGFSATCDVNVSLKSTLKYTLNSSTYANTYTSTELTEVLNLDSNLFNVVYDKNDASNDMYLINNTTESIRMYATKQTTKGNKFTVTIASEYTIDKINIVFYNNASETAQVLCGSNVIEENNGYYLINGTEFTVFNNNSSVDSNTQVKISKIDIFYRDASAQEKVERLDTQTELAYRYQKDGEGNFTYSDIVMRFGAQISKDLWNELDTDSHTITGFGVILMNGDLVTKEADVADAMTDMVPSTDAGGLTNHLAVDYFVPIADMNEKIGFDANNYFWNLRVSVDESEMSKMYTAVAYVKVGDEYVLLNMARESVETLALDYLTNRNCDDTTAGGSLQNIVDKAA